MLSPDYALQAVAAKGLAKLKDRDSIELIISACDKAPREAAAMIAESLVYFDDPIAQSKVDAYVPKDLAKYLREKRLVPGTDPFFH